MKIENSHTYRNKRESNKNVNTKLTYIQIQKRVELKSTYKTLIHRETNESQIKKWIQNSQTYRNKRESNKEVNTKLTNIQKQKRDK